MTTDTRSGNEGGGDPVTTDIGPGDQGGETMTTDTRPGNQPEDGNPMDGNNGSIGLNLGAFAWIITAVHMVAAVFSSSA